MIPYYGLILWTGTLYGGIKHVRLKDKKKTFVCLAFLSTVLLQSLRAEYVGGDMVQYLRGYELSAQRGWLDPVFNFELIFRILIHTLAVFHVPRQGFIAIMSVLCQAPIFYFFYRRAKNPCLSILIYFTFGLFTFSFSGIRQMIAIGLFLLAVLQAEDEQWLKFTALILLAAMFHKSALIGIVVWPLSKIKVKNHIVHFLMLGAFIVEIFMAPAIIQVAATLFGSYNTIQFTGAYACFLLYALIWFISSLLIRCDAPWNLYINCMYLAAAIQCLGLYHMNIGRVGYYFAFFECLLIPESIEKSTRSKFLKMVFYGGCVAFCLLYFYKNTGWGYLGVSPYVPFWK